MSEMFEKSNDLLDLLLQKATGESNNNNMMEEETMMETSETNNNNMNLDGGDFPPDEEESMLQQEDMTEAPVATEETTQDTQQQQQQVVSSWVIPLSTVTNNVTISEFYTQTYKMVRVKDPDGNPTSKFCCFVKHMEEEWKILPGLLSNQYSIVSIEAFVHALMQNIGGIEGSPRIYYDDWKILYEQQINEALDIWDYDDATKTVFSIITGAEVQTLESIRTKIYLRVVNSYDGTSKLNVSYGLSTQANVEGDSLEIRDMFSLSRYSHRLKHDQNLSEISSDIQSIRETISANMAVLKEAPVDRFTFDNVLERLNKENKNLLQNMWENLPENMKTYYYFGVLLSVTFTKNWNFSSYSKVEKILSSKIQSLFEE